MLSVISAKGKDVRDLLQRLTTNQVLSAVPTVIDNLFPDMNGRIVAPVQMWWLGTYGDWLAVEPAHVKPVLDWLDQMTFREDAVFALREDLFVERLWSHTAVSFSCDEHLAERSRPMGSRFLVERLVSRDRLNSNPPDPAEWRYRAFESGAPAQFLLELGVGHNPHEAGLHVWLNDRKGCYTGQEVIARLETYNKVQRSLEVHAVDGGGTKALFADGVQVAEVAAESAWPEHPTLLAAYVKKVAAQRDSLLTEDGRATKRVPLHPALA